jgi:lambda family phage minor tail protein L
MTMPTEQVVESYKLNPDALINLWEIRLRNNAGTIRLKDFETLTWQGFTWESCPIQLSGDERRSDGEESRPRLVVVNPFGRFTRFVLAGVLEYSLVIRKQVLYQHLISNANVYNQRMWKVGRVAQFVSGTSITLELRAMSDAPNFQIPGRQFMPPDFPLVTLG